MRARLERWAAAVLVTLIWIGLVFLFNVISALWLEAEGASLGVWTICVSNPDGQQETFCVYDANYAEVTLPDEDYEVSGWGIEVVPYGRVSFLIVTTGDGNQLANCKPADPRQVYWERGTHRRVDEIYGPPEYWRRYEVSSRRMSCEVNAYDEWEDLLWQFTSEGTVRWDISWEFGEEPPVLGLP